MQHLILFEIWELYFLAQMLAQTLQNLPISGLEHPINNLKASKNEIVLDFVNFEGQSSLRFVFACPRFPNLHELS